MLKKVFIFMPILYIIVEGLCPGLTTASNYLLTNISHWSGEDIAINNLSFGLLYTILMTYFLNKVKSIKFEYLVLLGGINQVLTSMSYFFMIKAREIDYYSMFAIQIFMQFAAQFALDMPQIAVIGRVSLYLPEGFESTGVTLVIAIGNIGLTVSNLLAAKEISAWGAAVGYYERLFWPVVINTVYSIFVVLVTPCFVMFRSQEEQAKAELEMGLRSHYGQSDSDDDAE